jgi:hypothetical protein
MPECKHEDDCPETMICEKFEANDYAYWCEQCGHMPDCHTTTKPEEE